MKKKISPKPGASTEISGDYGEKVPPVPIPNTEVKLLRVESTWLVTARESRSLPHSLSPLDDSSGVFLCLLEGNWTYGSKIGTISHIK